MVKVTLTGKRQTTTVAFGLGHAALVQNAKCGIMVRWNNGLYGAIVVVHHTGRILLQLDDNMIVECSECRVYRSTIAQIRAMLVHGN